MANNEVLSKQQAVLVTGAAGFVGRNLCARLQADGYTNVLRFDMDSPEGALEEYASRAAFVFHLAGVNRPQNAEEFYTGNADLTETLLSFLQKSGNKAPVLLTSSAQVGNGTDYAKSKQSAEEAVFAHSTANGSPVFVYRLPGLFGKWSRPSYNTVVATFCHNAARGLPLEVRDPAYTFPLCYIDDVVQNFLYALEGTKVPPAGNGFCDVEPVYTVSLGELATLVQSFAQNRQSLGLPDMSSPFEAKLYATYLSFLPVDDFAYPLRINTDERGSFTEFLRTPDRGQVSINVAKPGIVKGNHWHNTKNEKFLVVSGSAVIRFRQVGGTEVIEYRVQGDEYRVVDIPTGYTHNIENIGDTDLVTVMWASEPFNPEKPDTYFEKV